MRVGRDAKLFIDSFVEPALTDAVTGSAACVGVCARVFGHVLANHMKARRCRARNLISEQGKCNNSVNVEEQWMLN